MIKKIKIAYIMLGIILISLILITILYITRITREKPQKNIQVSLVDINFLKSEKCKYFSISDIDIISPELFAIRNCDSEQRSFSLVNKNNEIIDNDFKNNITIVYDNFFVDAPSFSGNSGYKLKLYDKNGILKLNETNASIFSENLIFIGDSFENDNGKLYNINNNKYSDNYKMLQYVQDNAIMIKDENSNIKIINSEFKIIKDFGKTNNKYILLNDNYVFDESNDKIIVLNNNKTIEKKYDEYYPFYNEFIEVCKNSKCGVIDINEDKQIVPLKYDDEFINLNYDNLTNTNSRMFNVINNNLIIIDDKYVYNLNGKYLFELENESYISTINNNYYIMEKFNDENTVKKIKIFDINGNITFEKNLYNSLYTEYSDYNKYIAYDNTKGEENSKYGIVDINGNIFLDFKYDNIDIYDGFYILNLNNQYAIYNYNNEEILPFGNYDIEWQNSNNNFDILLIQNLDTKDIYMLLTTFT